MPRANHIKGCVQTVQTVQLLRSVQAVQPEYPGFKVVHREVTEVTGTYTLRERGEAYGTNFADESEALRLGNMISGQKFAETAET